MAAREEDTDEGGADVDTDDDADVADDEPQIYQPPYKRWRTSAGVEVTLPRDTLVLLQSLMSRPFQGFLLSGKYYYSFIQLFHYCSSR